MKKLGISIAFMIIAAISVLAITITNSPSSCSGWASCSSANAADNIYASTTPNNNGAWTNYNFNIGGNKTITSVTVQVDYRATRTNGYTNVKVSSDGGATYGPNHQIGGNTVEQTYLIDVTSDAVWTNQSIQNIKVNATCVKVGNGGPPQCQIDWIPVIVTYN